MNKIAAKIILNEINSYFAWNFRNGGTIDSALRQ